MNNRKVTGLACSDCQPVCNSREVKNCTDQLERIKKIERRLSENLSTGLQCYIQVSDSDTRWILDQLAALQAENERTKEAALILLDIIAGHKNRCDYCTLLTEICPVKGTDGECCFEYAGLGETNGN